MRAYIPDQKILQRYADVLVNFALGDGKGIKKGDAVFVVCNEPAKPLYQEVLRAITRKGGNFISKYLPGTQDPYDADREFYLTAKPHQLSFFPDKYYRGLVDQIQHYLWLISEPDLRALKGVPPEKIMARAKAMRPWREWRDEKEMAGKFHWTLALYGTSSMAREAGLNEKVYWDQIIKACFLDQPDPIKKWREVDSAVRAYAKRINALRIDKLHMQGPDADIWFSLNGNRVWDGGGGRNIPSFEIFTSPDWRGTEGWVRFNNPVYNHGDIIKDISLKFRKGRVIEAKAAKNQKLLSEMMKVPGGDKVGEFSLTDRRFSRISKFMAETMYDENVGGPNGNTHIAVGRSFHSCYRGDSKKFKAKDWTDLGFNGSAIHQDMVSTAPRTVVAQLVNGQKKVIYKNGQFAL